MIWALYPNPKDDVKRKTTQFDIFIKNFFHKTRSVDYACETSNCHTFCPTIRSQNLTHLLPNSQTQHNWKSLGLKPFKLTMEIFVPIRAIAVRFSLLIEPAIHLLAYMHCRILLPTSYCLYERRLLYCLYERRSLRCMSIKLCHACNAHAFAREYI